MKTFALAIGVTIGSWMIAGCAARAQAPEPVPLDRIECASCRMIVSTETGAAQIVSAAEETRFYDDVGCLAADWPSHARESTPYVHVEGAWIDARRAFFAQPATARTAMGSGFVAFATAAEARAADRGLRSLGWDEVVTGAGDAP